MASLIYHQPHDRYVWMDGFAWIHDNLKITLWETPFLLATVSKVGH